MEGMLPLINPPFPTRGRRPSKISHLTEVTMLIQRSPESILKAFTSLLLATQENAGPRDHGERSHIVGAHNVEHLR